MSPPLHIFPRIYWLYYLHFLLWTYMGIINTAILEHSESSYSATKVKQNIGGKLLNIALGRTFGLVMSDTEHPIHDFTGTNPWRYCWGNHSEVTIVEQPVFLILIHFLIKIKKHSSSCFMKSWFHNSEFIRNSIPLGQKCIKTLVNFCNNLFRGSTQIYSES